jgi:hypothetical protein
MRERKKKKVARLKRCVEKGARLVSIVQYMKGTSGLALFCPPWHTLRPMWIHKDTNILDMHA